MRTKSLYLVTAVMLALSGAAIAQTAGTRASTSGTTATATTSPAARAAPTTTTTGTVAGGCVGSGGSSCSSSNTNTAGASTSTTTTTSQTGGTVGSTGGSTPGVAQQTGSPAQVDNVRSTDPAATQPGPFDAGGAFGPAAVPPTNTANTGTTTDNSGLVAPGTVGTSQLGTQQNVFVQPQQQPSGVTVLNTPIFDQAAREGRAKEARRRARGEEPRVYGIAPRTERDLTWQMPDDPIIRY
jgi:hypothetical protein